MKKSLLFAIGCMASFIAPAQITYNPASSPQFVLSPTAFNPPLLQRGMTPAQGSPAAAFVFEFGDGHFTTEPGANHAYRLTRSDTTVLTLSGRYDTIKPPKIAARIFNITGTGVAPLQQQMLQTDEFIRITPISTTLNQRDETLFIVTYRLPAGATEAQVYFLYNQTTFNLMVPVEDAPLIQEIDGPSINRVRTHYGEQLTTAAGIPFVQNSGYLNFLAWNVTTDSGTDERNIFISLRTADTFPQWNSGTFMAGIKFLTEDVKTRRSSIAADTSIVRMDASANPHDPNYIIAVPRCLIKGNSTKTVNYRLHFQNEGPGSAHRLRIDVFLGQQLRQAVENHLDKNSFNIKVGNKRIHRFKYEEHGTRLRFEIELDKIRSQDNPQVEFIDSTLSSNKVMNWAINPLTMGDIYFDVPVPVTAEADIKSYAAITFYSRDDDSMLPVTTDTSLLFVREKCERNVRPLQPCTDCCVTILFLCWWWWVIIAVTLLISIVLWLLFRRKTQRRNERKTGK